MRVLILAAAALLGAAGCASPDFPRRPTAQEIDIVEGVYGLDDGFRAHLYGLDDRLYVRIGAGSQKELRMVGPDQFASRAGDVAIRMFPDWRKDDVEHIMVEYERAPDAHPQVRFASGLRPGRGVVD